MALLAIGMGQTLVLNFDRSTAAGDVTAESFSQPRRQQ